MMSHIVNRASSRAERTKGIYFSALPRPPGPSVSASPYHCPTVQFIIWVERHDSATVRTTCRPRGGSMGDVRPAAVAGLFYPDDPTILMHTVERLLAEAER